MPKTRSVSRVDYSKVADLAESTRTEHSKRTGSTHTHSRQHATIATGTRKPAPHVYLGPRHSKLRLATTSSPQTAVVPGSRNGDPIPKAIYNAWQNSFGKRRVSIPPLSPTTSMQRGRFFYPIGYQYSLIPCILGSQNGKRQRLLRYYIA